jgi:hypothetical protein
MSPWHAFVWGAASVLNLAGDYPSGQTLEMDDAQAIAGDFERVGGYIAHAMSNQPVHIILESSEPFLPGFAA